MFYKKRDGSVPDEVSNTDINQFYKHDMLGLDFLRFMENDEVSIKSVSVLCTSRKTKHYFRSIEAKIQKMSLKLNFITFEDFTDLKASAIFMDHLNLQKKDLFRKKYLEESNYVFLIDSDVRPKIQKIHQKSAKRDH